MIAEMRRCVEQLADPRRGRNTQYRFNDIAMAAFSVFFMQSPSFLSHQRRMAQSRDGDSCAASLFGMARIPCDNHIRQSLDGISLESFYAVLDAALTVLRQKPGGLKSFRRLGGRCLIALDGTEFHRSTMVHCKLCSTRTSSSTGEIQLIRWLSTTSIPEPS